MKIKRIEPIPVSFPMKKPVFMAGVEIRQADNVPVRVIRRSSFRDGAQAPGPESITTAWAYGFRARGLKPAPRNDAHSPNFGIAALVA